MTDGGTNALAAHGLEELFSSCAVVSVFWFLVGNSFSCYLPTIPVVLLCLFLVVAGLQRSVFWLWQEIGLGITYLHQK
jgi:hypothetical protein